MQKIIWTLIFLFYNLLCVKAQQDSVQVSSEVDFLLYLIENKQLDNAEYFSNKVLNDSISYPADLCDSVSYICGAAWERFMKPEKAIFYYDKVHDNSVFYYPAGYRSGLLEAERKNYPAARMKFEGILYDENDYFTALKKFELSGVYLLLRDYAAFDSIQSGFQTKDSLLIAENEYLIKYNSMLRSQKKKSPLLAGVLSAMIPGLGKVYTGKPGQALAAFIKTVPLAAIAFENYRVNGFRSPQFFIFGSLFTLFYVGNIWGSSLSAKIVYQEKTDEILHNIVVGLRIPVDKFFR